MEKSVVVLYVGSDMPVVMEEAVRAAKMPLSLAKAQHSFVR
jgi:hypothetical protein